ncbi:hypothetical protein AHAS_Ahas06G0162500 [Arachis hypogaea]
MASSSAGTYGTPQGFAASVTLSRAAWLTKLCVRTIIGAIRPALMHRIPSELRRHLRASRNGLILDGHLRCDHTSTNAPDPIKTPQTPKGELQRPHPRQAPTVTARLRG